MTVQMGPQISSHEINFHERLDGSTIGTDPQPTVAYVVLVRAPGAEKEERDSYHHEFESALRATCVICDDWEEQGVTDGHVTIAQSIITDVCRFWPKTAVEVVERGADAADQ